MDKFTRELVLTANFDASAAIEQLNQLRQKLAGVGDAGKDIAEILDKLSSTLQTGTTTFAGIKKTADEFGNVIQELPQQLTAVSSSLESVLGDGFAETLQETIGNIHNDLIAAYSVSDDEINEILTSLEKLTTSTEETVETANVAVLKLLENSDKLATMSALDLAKAVERLDGVRGKIEHFGDSLARSAIDNALEALNSALSQTGDVVATAEQQLQVLEKRLFASNLSDIDSLADEYRQFLQSIDKNNVALLETVSKRIHSLDIISTSLKKLEQHQHRVNAVLQRGREAFDAIGESVSHFTQQTTELTTDYAAVQSVIGKTAERFHVFGEILDRFGVKQRLVANFNDLMKITALKSAEAYKEHGLSLKMVTGLMKSFSTSTIGANAAAKALRATLASLGLGLIAIALGLILENFGKIKNFILDFISRFKILHNVVTGALDAVLDVLSMFGLAEERSARKARAEIARIDIQLQQLYQTQQKGVEGVERAVAREIELHEEKLKKIMDIAEAQAKHNKKLDEEDQEMMQRTIETIEELYQQRLEQAQNAVDREIELLSKVGVSAVELEAKKVEEAKKANEKLIKIYEDYQARGGKLTEEQTKKLRQLYKRREEIEHESFKLSLDLIAQRAERQQETIDMQMRLASAEGRHTYNMEMQKLKIQRDSVRAQIQQIKMLLDAKKVVTEEDRKQTEEMKKQLELQEQKIQTEMIALRKQMQKEIADELFTLTQDIKTISAQLESGVAQELASAFATLENEIANTAKASRELQQRFYGISDAQKILQKATEKTVLSYKVAVKAFQDSFKSIRESVQQTLDEIKRAQAELITLFADIEQKALELSENEWQQTIGKEIIGVADSVAVLTGKISQLKHSTQGLVGGFTDANRVIANWEKELTNALNRLSDLSSKNEISLVKKRAEIQKRQLEASLEQQKIQWTAEIREMEKRQEQLTKEIDGARKKLEQLRNQFSSATFVQHLDDEQKKKIADEIQQLESLIESNQGVFESYQRVIEGKKEYIRQSAELLAKERENIDKRAKIEEELIQKTAEAQKIRNQLATRSLRETDRERLKLERQLAELELQMASLRGDVSAIEALRDKLLELGQREVLAPLRELAETATAVSEAIEGLTNAVSAAFDAFSKLGDKETSRVFKAFAVADVVAKTAQSIMNAVLVAQQGAIGTGPLAPFTFITFLSGQLATILSAVAQINQILGTNVQVPDVETPEFDWGQAMQNMMEMIGRSTYTGDTMQQQDLRVYVLDSDIVGVRNRNERAERTSVISK